MGLFKSDADAAREREESRTWHLARAFWPVIVHQGGIVWGGQEYVRALNTAYVISAFECKRIDDDSIKLVGTPYSDRNRYHKGLEAWPVGDDRRPPAPTPTRPRRSIGLPEVLAYPEVRELLLISRVIHKYLDTRPDTGPYSIRLASALKPFEVQEGGLGYDPKEPLELDPAAFLKDSF